VAVQELRARRILALPTETFYGMAVDGLDPEALSSVNELKGKAEGSPILLLVADAAQASRVSRAPGEAFAALSERFWPGPLTLVVPAAPVVPPEVSGGRGTVAVRAPGLALPRRLASRLGRPISGVSANRHGESPCRTAAEVVEAFPDGVELVLDGGPTPGRAPSTVLDLTGRAPRVLRDGALPPEAIARLLSERGLPTL
jgi:tRNA threonylcarbamoyl adenosine modification protein (Sua5/YciO/YrdC/YwlC family)